jgi:hypothetical protein
MSALALGEAFPLHGWENVYVIVGSSAAALTGLTFIVITISAEAAESDDGVRTPAARLRGLRAFITPIAVHFCAALWVSVLMSVPGQTAYSLAICLGVTGLAGLWYCATVIQWLLRATATYRPFLADWIWNAVLPTFAYLCVLTVALLLYRLPWLSLYIVAASTVLLLFIGIHNAWDIVAWITTERHAHERRQPQSDQPPRASSAP